MTHTDLGEVVRHPPTWRERDDLLQGVPMWYCLPVRSDEVSSARQLQYLRRHGHR
jgi:hypothetical protein